MSIFNIEKDRKIHISIFVALISTVAISILIISSILYFNFEDILRNKIFNYTLNNLPQTDQSTEMMSGIANRISKQIYNDIHISEILNYTTKDIIEINAALLQLNYYRNTSEFIDSIYIYNDRSKTFYNSSDVGRNAIQNKKDFYDQDIVKVIENYGEYPSMMPIPRSISVEYPVEKK
ncbi:MAG: hypothetical protein QME45_11210 [Clostridiales bacterium]|nr:hypothetical protein [Clostridiales bacterium]